MTLMPGGAGDAETADHDAGRAYRAVAEGPRDRGAAVLGRPQRRTSRRRPAGHRCRAERLIALANGMSRCRAGHCHACAGRILLAWLLSAGPGWPTYTWSL